MESGLAAAIQQDLQLVAAALQLADKDSAARARLEAAAQGLRECRYIPPMAAVLTAKPTGAWGGLLTRRLEEDPEYPGVELSTGKVTDKGVFESVKAR